MRFTSPVNGREKKDMLMRNYYDFFLVHLTPPRKKEKEKKKKRKKEKKKEKRKKRNICKDQVDCMGYLFYTCQIKEVQINTAVIRRAKGR